MSLPPRITVLLLLGALLPADVPDPVRIAAVVTDRQGRSITGLSARDFELREDGVVQPLLSAEPRRPEARRLAIVLDEFHVGAADSIRVREAVGRFAAEQLRPGDAAVVLKPLDSLTTIRLTTDRAAAQSAIASFEGRKERLEPRSVLEEETLGRAPALVEAGRAQVVLSALRALASRLGSEPGRAAIFLVSEGFPAPARRMGIRGLPDAGIVERFANRYDVPIYAFDPRALSGDADAPSPVLARLVSETGGTLTRGGDLAANLARAAGEIDSGYTLTYRPSRNDDGRYHPVTISVVRREADARSRAGYIAPPSAEARRAAREASLAGSLTPSRMLRRSPLIDVWSGVTRASSSTARVMVTWEPDRDARGGRSGAASVQLKATSKDGKVLYEGTLGPVRVGEGSGGASPDRAEFDAPPGAVQLDLTIFGVSGQKLDVDARDVDVPVMKDGIPLLLPAVLIATQSAREFRIVAADADAAPAPSREFRRTERLVIRVPAYASGAPVPVTARLLNRLAQTMRDLPSLPDAAGGVTQFDLPLAPLAPGEYFLQFTVKGPSGPISQRLSFRITG